MKNQTIAIVGLGAAAQSIHLPAYRRVPRLQVTGGVDPHVPSHGFPFPVFTDVDRLLAHARPDILAVVTPPESHFTIVRAALLAGCHVFCEKPFMNSLDEADEIIDLATRVGRRVVVNNQYRFMNIHRAAKEWIDRPEFGRLLFVDARQSFFTTPETEKGWRGTDIRRTCKEFGTHVFDLCRYFFGEEPHAISARMPRVGREGPDYLVLARLEFSGDRVAQVTLDRLSRGPHDYLTIRLDGTNGCLESHLGGGIEVCAGVRGGSRRPFFSVDASLGGRVRLYHGERKTKIASDRLDVFARATAGLLQAFLTALERGETPPCDAVDNRRTLELMLTAYEASEAGSLMPVGAGRVYRS